jgi:hypothetical protein
MSKLESFGELKALLNKMSAAIKPKLSTYALYLSGYHIRQMKKRIERGIDLSGSPFLPYTPEYARRKLQNYGKLPSWLVASRGPNAMIRTLSAQLWKPGEASIIFGNQGAAEISYYNEYGRKPRTHFGYTEMEKTKLKEALWEQVSKDIERIWNDG